MSSNDKSMLFPKSCLEQNVGLNWAEIKLSAGMYYLLEVLKERVFDSQVPTDSIFLV